MILEATEQDTNNNDASALNTSAAIVLENDSAYYNVWHNKLTIAGYTHCYRVRTFEDLLKQAKKQPQVATIFIGNGLPIDTNACIEAIRKINQANIVLTTGIVSNDQTIAFGGIYRLLSMRDMVLFLEKALSHATLAA